MCPQWYSCTKNWTWLSVTISSWTNLIFQMWPVYAPNNPRSKKASSSWSFKLEKRRREVSWKVGWNSRPVHHWRCDHFQIRKLGICAFKSGSFALSAKPLAHIKKCFQFSSSPTSPRQVMSGKAKRDIEKRTRQLLRRNILLVLKFLGLITAHPGVLKLTLKSNINGVSGSKALAPPATKDAPHSTARLPRMGVPVN